MALRTLVSKRLFNQCCTKTNGAVSSTKFVCFHTNISLCEKEKSKMVGNPYFSAAPDVTAKFAPAKWEHHWLNLMKRKALLESEVEPKRTDQLNWNYAAELQAFAHRLQIQDDTDSLKQAFTELTHDDVNEISEINNTAMFESGQKFALSFIELYLAHVFPDLGDECRSSCINYLMSDDLISHVSNNLGCKDLIKCPEYPIPSVVLTRCFYAIITVIQLGPGGSIEAAKFLHDFVLTNLNDKDIIHDIWKPQDPMKILIQELSYCDMAIPEVRLTKQSGVASVLPVFFVGIFCDKILLAESGGESIIKAETDAAKLALKKIYDVGINRYLPFVDVFSNYEFCQKISSIELDTNNVKKISAV